MNQHQLASAAGAYALIRERIKAAEGDAIDDVTLADTVEGLTDLHEILSAVVRSALVDQAHVEGVKGYISAMQERVSRLEERVSGKRRIVRDVMANLSLNRVAAPDFTISLRMGQPSLEIVSEPDIPQAYWKQREPVLNRAALISDLKAGVQITGATLLDPEQIIAIRTR